MTRDEGVSQGYVCMYVFMYRGHPLWNCPLLRAIQLNQGEGPIGIMGPMSQPRGIVTHAFNKGFLRQLYSRQLRVTWSLYRGTESHQARGVPRVHGYLVTITELTEMRNNTWEQRLRTFPLTKVSSPIRHYFKVALLEALEINRTRGPSGKLLEVSKRANLMS